MCGEEKPLSDFYAYGYIARSGKQSTRYESRCKPCAVVRRRREYHADPGKHRMISNRWKSENRDRLKSYNSTKQRDPEYRAMKAKNQRLRKARMRSGSGDDDAIRAIYAEAMEVERIVANCPVFDIPEIGKKMHVDHIVPLSRGGLHVADNLQILPIGLNMRKGAKCPR